MELLLKIMKKIVCVCVVILNSVLLYIKKFIGRLIIKPAIVCCEERCMSELLIVGIWYYSLVCVWLVKLLIES